MFDDHVLLAAGFAAIGAAVGGLMGFLGRRREAATDREGNFLGAMGLFQDRVVRQLRECEEQHDECEKAVRLLTERVKKLEQA